MLLAVLMLLCALTACNTNSGTADISGDTPRPGVSDQKEPANAPQNDADKAAGAQIMPGLTEDQAQQIDMPPEQLGKMGEAVGAMEVQNGSAVPDALFYTINKATMFDDFEAAGIESDAMGSLLTDEDLTDENGDPKPGVKFLLIELTVQNVSAAPERNITALRLLSAGTGSSSNENAEASFYEVYPSEPAYFSNPTGKRVGDDWKEYYDYKLPAGQTKTLKVGWYVDTEQYDEQNMYLTFDYDEYQKYIKIEF